MKNKMFLLLFFLTLLALEINAQAKIPIYKLSYKSLNEFQGDITQYFLYNFIDGKDDLLGKKVSYVLNTLEPKAITYLPDLSGSLTTGLQLYFNGVDTAILSQKDREQKELELFISFTDGVSWDSIISLYKKNKKQWTKEERQFYGKSIIKSIKLYEISPEGKPVLLGAMPKEEPPTTEYKRTIIH